MRQLRQVECRLAVPGPWRSAKPPFALGQSVRGIEAEDAHDLRRLKGENWPLKRMAAVQALDILVLKKVARHRWPGA
ncbi:MAG: hypothetical protein ACREOD_07680 [Candidatus Dormibacteria bacterium]